MRELTRLQAYHELTHHEAVEILLSWAKRHTGMLDNLLRIKSVSPQQEGEQGGFRRQRQDSVSLEQLQSLLSDFTQALSHQDTDDNAILLDIIQNMVNKLTKLYEGKSTAFAVILNELNALENALLQKFPQKHENQDIVSSKHEHIQKAHKNLTYVYVRVVNRQIPLLLLPQSDHSWVKTLLDSARDSEKHGLAVYANEEDVKRSLRGENYGYIAVAITDEQDITSQRRVKQDPQLQCQLLTLAPVDLDQLKKLTYAETEYLIENGLIVNRGK